jgi:hypothetical protein
MLSKAPRNLESAVEAGVHFNSHRFDKPGFGCAGLRTASSLPGGVPSDGLSGHETPHAFDSGLIYPGVPTMAPTRVNIVSAVSRCEVAESPSGAHAGRHRTQPRTAPAAAANQLVLVAVIGDGNAGDVLHHEVRPALFRRTGVEHPGDGRMVHQRQRLPFGFEPRYQLPACPSRP